MPQSAPCVLVEEIPAVTIENGLFVFTVRTGDKFRRHAYTPHHLTRLHREVGGMLAEFYAQTTVCTPSVKWQMGAH